MRTRVLLLAILISCFAIAVFAQQHAAQHHAAQPHPPHWGYSGPQGPEHWAQLDPKFSLCSSGKNQSPVNLTGLVQAELAALTFDYRPGGDEVILNNGHTIQVNYQPGSSFAINGHSYELKQFHFHAPSENLVEGKSFPLEVHFVHADSHGDLAVIAVFFEEGGTNSELEKAWAQMPTHIDENHPLHPPVSAAALLPANTSYYRFNGSLTTPPCSEGVAWFVMKQTMTVSKEEVEKFSHTMHHPNNRPVQPVNARVLLK